MNRDELQEEAGNKWLTSSQKATLILGTGFGKSKVCIDILTKLNLGKEAKILLLVDNSVLRDDNWKEEFLKWDKESIWNQVNAQCYQTAYKWKDTEWDLVIADEIDFAMTESYSQFFSNNKCKRILGLSGTMTADKEMMYLDAIAPIIHTYTTNQAQADGILNKTKLVFVEFTLSNAKDREVKYVKSGKSRSFKQSENEAYVYLNEQIAKSLTKAKIAERDNDFGLNQDAVDKAWKTYNMFVRKRKELLHSLASSARTAKKLREMIHSANPDNKILGFSYLTEQVEQFCEHTYTGKNKKNNTGLKDISDSKIHHLGLCKAIDRGANLVGVNNIIMESYIGSDTQFQQRNGRGCRLNPDQTMHLYILLPYYLSPVNDGTGAYEKLPTQAHSWANSMLEGFKCDDRVTIRL